MTSWKEKSFFLWVFDALYIIISNISEYIKMMSTYRSKILTQKHDETKNYKDSLTDNVISIIYTFSTVLDFKTLPVISHSLWALLMGRWYIQRLIWSHVVYCKVQSNIMCHYEFALNISYNICIIISCRLNLIGSFQTIEKNSISMYTMFHTKGRLKTIFMIVFYLCNQVFL